MTHKPVQQAAALPYRRNAHGGLEVLLVSRTGGGWGLPKGGVKKGHTPEHTAAIETLEEAGVLGTIEETIGAFSYRKRGRKCRVSVYPLRVERVLDRWEEEGARLRIWIALTEAPRLIGRKGAARLLTKFRHRLLVPASGPALRLAA